jgi:hypothetical protein
MASPMQLYAGFALVVIAAIIVLAAIVSNLLGALRRRFGRTRASRSGTPNRVRRIRALRADAAI